MIVRISGEDQYRLADGDGRIEQLEDAAVKAVEGQNPAQFASSYKALLDYVRSNGQPVADDDLEISDLILPPADLTLAEAQQEFTGEGLLPN
jgi:hypothetical protein